MILSAEPAESPVEKVRMLFGVERTSPATAENTGNLRPFSTGRLTTSSERDCYTFEIFASDSDEIRNACYYYYKRTSVGLKEDTTWS